MSEELKKMTDEELEQVTGGADDTTVRYEIRCKTCGTKIAEIERPSTYRPMKGATDYCLTCQAVMKVEYIKIS